MAKATQNDIPPETDEQEEQSPYGAWVPEPLATTDSTTAEQEEQQYIKASLPVIQDVLDWYDECIDKFNRPDVIDGVNPSTPAETVKEAVLYAKQQVAGYRAKKKEFVQRFSDYIDTEGGGTDE